MAFSSVVATNSETQIPPKFNNVKQLFYFANKFFRSGIWTGLYEDSWPLLKRLKCQERLNCWGLKSCLLLCLAQGLEEFED